MKGKFTNTVFVAVLILGFTLFVSGLARSTAPARPAGGAAQTPIADPSAPAEEPAAPPTSAPASVPRDPRIEATATPTRTPTPINVGNFVWDDIDDDGRQDAGEPGMAGVTVQLWNATKTALLGSTTTNANGNYTLIAPTPGDYRVRVLLPNPSLDQFSPKNQAAGDDLLDSDINPSGTDFGFTDVYTFASNLISITSIDAGIIRFTTPTPTRTPTPVNIGNFVWRDLDGDGVQDAGEPGEPDVVVQVWNDAKTQLIDQSSTNASGNYTVQTPGPGTFRIRVLPPAGTSFTVKDAAAATDQTDSDINPTGVNEGFTDSIVIASNVISTTIWDAGLVPTNPNNIGNRVWNDLDGNGVQDAGEPGVGGITVRLHNSIGTVVSTAVTSSTGLYTLQAPSSGSFRVSLASLPTGFFAYSPANAGANDNLDSEVNAAGTTPLFPVPAGINSITWDIGLVPVLYEPLVPARVLDTRNQPTVDGSMSNIGKRTAGSTLQLPIGGRDVLAGAGALIVPTNASAVVLNITATEVGADGFVTAFPCGQPIPNASNLNVVRNGTVAGAVTVKLGTSSAVCIFTSSATHLIADIAGYFPGTTPFAGLQPARLMDTRNSPTVDGQSQNLGKQVGGTTRELQVTGRGGVPANASAVLLNLTITSPNGAGFASLYPCGASVPGTSSVNYVAGQTIPNMVVSAIGASGRVCILTFATTDIIVDVAGYFPAGSGLQSPAPARLLDTRPAATVDGQFSNLGKVPANTSIAFTVTNRGGVPAAATTVVLNVTANEPNGDGFLVVYPCGGPPPGASNVNYVAGQTIANAVVVKVGAGGQVCVFTSQTAHVIADVTASMVR